MQKKMPAINPVVVLRKEFDDWAVLFNPDTAEAVGINPVGVAIWEMLSRQDDRDSILAGISRTFAEVPATLAADVDSFITELAGHGFVGYAVKDRDNG
jgi:hypothetical protein